MKGWICTLILVFYRFRRKYIHVREGRREGGREGGREDGRNVMGKGGRRERGVREGEKEREEERERGREAISPYLFFVF